jgi:hypothetical protein
LPLAQKTLINHFLSCQPKTLCGQPFALFFSKKVGRKGFLSQQSSGVAAQTTRQHRLIQDDRTLT